MYTINVSILLELHFTPPFIILDNNLELITTYNYEEI
jgi:hypothetical protein